MGATQVDEKAVFNAAREIGNREARESYLQLACGADAEALRRIHELLRLHEQERSFLESPPGGTFAPAAAELPLESAGSTIGPYRLLEQIGEGGFGVVFMAEQTAPVRRKVALKVLKPGVDTRQVIARFEAERQALALMDHPHIAKVLDAGATATGRPYFVMELVRGVPITEYCDAHHLTPRQRLELFVTVCNAVQHAHQKGIIHRDIKPSNVLVTLHDDRPVAKVIDFGIAKATSGQLTDKTLFTGFAQLIGTPLYMSPEQAAMSAIDVDTRSDIYSLGVLLYELLTGTTPFEESRLKEAAFDEIRRIIREEEPAKPSTRLSTSDALPTLSANRGTEPAKLTRLVRGELDWIVMKALEKDRVRRYETANGLATDVQRYLADEAVSACPPSATYRLRKFAVRNRRALLTSALVGAMLLVVAGVLGWMALDGAARRGRNAEAVGVLLDQVERALREEALDRAAVALEAAEQRAADGGAEEFANRVARGRADLALVRALDGVDSFLSIRTSEVPPSAQEKAARWRAALADHDVPLDEGGTRRVNESLVGDRVLGALDRLLVHEPSPALRALLRATDPDPYRDAVRDAIAARDDAALASLSRQPEALTQPPRFAAALGLIEGVPMERRRTALETALRGRPADVGLLLALANTYPEKGKSRSAEAVAERVRWCQAAVTARPDNVAAWNNLALALRDRKDRAGAIACYRQALRRAPTVAPIHMNLGVVLRDDGDVDAAIACHEQAIRIDPDLVAAHNNLGVALEAKGRPDLAIASYERAIAIDPRYAKARVNLGVLVQAQGDSASAVTYYEEAIRLDPTEVVTFTNLTAALVGTGEADKAVAAGENAVALDPLYAAAHRNLGIALDSKGEPEKAIACFEQAIRLDPDDPQARDALGVTLLNTGDLTRAIASLEAAIRLDPGYADAYAHLANCFIAKGEPDRAVPHAETAIRLRPTRGAAHGSLGAALYAAKGDLDRVIACYREAIRLEPNEAAWQIGLGCALHDKGELDRAIECYEEAIRLSPGDANAHVNAGTAFQEKGDVDRAIACYEQALRLAPSLAEAHGNLSSVLSKKGKFDDAIASAKEGVRLAPNDPVGHFILGNALRGRGDTDLAISSFERAIQLDPMCGKAHVNIGVLLVGKGDLDGAVARFEEAIRIDATHANAHSCLGSARAARGEWEKAGACFREAIRLNPNNPEYRRSLALATRLPEVLAGDAASPREQVDLAEFCLHVKRPLDAARLYERAFVAEPSLAETDDARRYNAACAAALAAGGRGHGAEALESSDKARLRKQALDWLRAELAAQGKFPLGDPAAAGKVPGFLQHWLSDPDLSGVRDAQDLAGLADDERQLWTKLWSDVRDLMARAAKR